MLFLISSIICSVLVSVLLKVAKGQGVSLAVAITVNYVVCSLLAWVVFAPMLDSAVLSSGIGLFVALGILLPSVFLIMGKSVETAGIVKSDTAQRVALIIPILSAFLLFGESLTAPKLIALILVFVAMGCLLYKKSDNNNQNQSFSIWLIGVFLGYAVIDVLLKQLSKLGGATTGNLLISFILALIFMIGVLIVKKIKPSKNSLVAGVILGGLNFANIYTYISAHKAMSDTPTLVFAGMNMGVIVLGALTGLVFFKEKINAVNAVGIVLALVAIGQLFLR